MTLSKTSLLVPWIFALGMFVIGTTSLSILGVGPAMTRDLNVSPGLAGWLVTSFAATFAISAPTAQFIFGRRHSPRTLIIVGTGILTVALIWSSLAAGFASLLMSRVVAAIGAALIAPTCAALAIAIAPEGSRGAFLAIVFTGFTLSTVVGVPLVTWLTLFLGWRGAMAAIAATGLLVLILAAANLPAQVEATESGPVDPDSGFDRWRTALGLLTTLGVLAAQFTIYSLMGEALGDVFGVSKDRLPVAILIFGIFGVVGNAVAGALMDRVEATALIWLSMVALAIMLVLLNIVTGPVAGTLAFAGCAFAGTLFTTPQQSRLAELVQRDRQAMVLALNSSASYLGIALGSSVASLSFATHGLEFLPIAALGVLVFAGIANALWQLPRQPSSE